MNNPDNKKNTPEIPDELLEAAAIWQARLREMDADSDKGRKIKAGFNAWLLENPLHRQAHAQMQWLWEALEVPTRNAMEEQPASKTLAVKTLTPIKSYPAQRASSRSWYRFATAACLIVALFAGLGWQQHWLIHWQSDYITAVGEQAPIMLKDNSRITLNTHSAIAVHYADDERRVRLLKGEAWFEVVSDRDRSFVVETTHGAVRVTGTQFNVRLEKDTAIVSLDEGGVQLHSDSDPQASLALAPGQQAQLSKTGITALGDFDRTAVTAWLRGQFVFYNTPLGEVVDTLNRYRQGRILVTSNELNALKVNGVFSTRDPDAALALITDALPVQQTRLTDYLVLLR